MDNASRSISLPAMEADPLAAKSEMAEKHPPTSVSPAMLTLPPNELHAPIDNASSLSTRPMVDIKPPKATSRLDDKLPPTSMAGLTESLPPSATAPDTVSDSPNAASDEHDEYPVNTAAPAMEYPSLM